MFVLAQVFGFFGLLFGCVFAFQQKSKKKIFICSAIADFFDMVMYLLLNGISGFFTKLIAFIRNLVMINKEKYKILDSIWLFVFFFCLYIVMALFSFDGVISLLPFSAALIYFTVAWFCSKTSVKMAGAFCSFLWLIYNISIISIFGIVSNIITIVSALVGIYRDKC